MSASKYGVELVTTRLYTTVDTKFGKLYIADNNGIDYVGTEKPDCEKAEILNEGRVKRVNNENLEKAVQFVKHAVNGEVDRSLSVPIILTGTDFQIKVYMETLKIPYGKTATYSDIADRIGDTGARAVGTALSKNPLLFLVPCHRVINKNGSCGSYILGSEAKKELLELEMGD